MKLLIPTISSILLLMISIAPIKAARILVDKKAEFTSISDAVQAAQNGDTVLISPGIYFENDILIDKSIIFTGIDFPEINGGNSGAVLTIRADEVLVSGIKFSNAGVSFINDNAALKIEKSKNCRIINNKFENNFFGIYLSGSESCLVEKNILISNATRQTLAGNGIHLWYCKDITIKDNRVSGHRDGIYFEFVESGAISGNLSERNLRYGLHFMFSNHCRYTENTFRQNGAGVAVMYTHHVSMKNNIFENNWGAASYGLLLKEIRDSDIIQNEFRQNTIGLYSEASNRLNIRNNRFSGNGWAVKIMANSMDNKFEENNFINNSFDIATNSRQNFNIFSGNYWTRYSGYDLDRDGTGDVPYRPVKLFSFLVEQQHVSLILLRSIFIDALDIAESVFPVLTPETLTDNNPKMNPIP